MTEFLKKFAVLTVVCLPQAAVAQGLLFSIPATGSWVRYEGTVKQTDARPERPEGVEELSWIRHMTIKSLEPETASWRGTEQPCRWVEIKVITGEPSEAGIDPGPIGARTYKVLIPEAAIDGKPVDPDGIPVSMLPIVRGFKRVGQGQVTPIRAQALRVFPTISLLSNYADPKLEVPAGNPGAPVPVNNARQLSGSVVMESRRNRISNAGKFWLSNDVPFGIVSWTVKVTRESKGLTDPRTAFKQVSLVEVTMSAHEVGQMAEAEIAEK